MLKFQLSLEQQKKVPPSLVINVDGFYEVDGLKERVWELIQEVEE